MRIDDAVLYDRFEQARLKAVELTDTYRATAADDPRRAVLWESVMRQTEVARGLLESWLHENGEAPQSSVNALLTVGSSTVNVA